MTSILPDDNAPQFQTVEYEVKAGSCFVCNQPIAGMHYRINGEQACATCAEREKAGQSDTATHYSRALIFGFGAAIVGLIGYATFAIVTGIVIGYLSLAVGWLIGKAMLKGSNGRGGRKYQITAILLTYFAVSMAAIPVMFSQLAKEKKIHVQQSRPQFQAQPTPSAPPNSAPQTSTSTSDAAEAGAAGEARTAITGKPDGNVETTKPQPRMSFGKAVGMLVLLGLASPFLELASPISGLIGLVILFVGMQIAWKMMARPQLVIDGPF
jgi:hypothetical protein